MERKVLPHPSHRYFSQTATSRSRFMGPPPPHMFITSRRYREIFYKNLVPGTSTPSYPEDGGVDPDRTLEDLADIRFRGYIGWRYIARIRWISFLMFLEAAT
jgi:hypothetical protein